MAGRADGLSGNCWSENTVAIHFPGQYLTNSFPALYGRQLKELVWSMVHPSCIQTLVFISQQCDQVTIFTVVESCQLKKLPRKAFQPLVVTTCGRPGFGFAAGTPHRHATRCLLSQAQVLNRLFTRQFKKPLLRYYFARIDKLMTCVMSDDRF